nr:unnamed protein product [Callosobruchus chinensis]
MLSYMLPVDEKPPPGPGKARLQLSLGPNSTTATTAPAAYATASNGRPSPISKETSVSSLASDVTTATVTSVATATGSATPSSDRGKVKATAVNGKHPPLKRLVLWHFFLVSYEDISVFANSLSDDGAADSKQIWWKVGIIASRQQEIGHYNNYYLIGFNLHRLAFPVSYLTFIWLLFHSSKVILKFVTGLIIVITNFKTMTIRIYSLFVPTFSKIVCSLKVLIQTF